MADPFIGEIGSDYKIESIIFGSDRCNVVVKIRGAESIKIFIDDIPSTGIPTAPDNMQGMVKAVMGYFYQQADKSLGKSKQQATFVTAVESAITLEKERIVAQAAMLEEIEPK